MRQYDRLQLIQRCLQIAKDGSLDGGEKLYRIAANTTGGGDIYRYLYKEVFNEWPVTSNKIIIKMAVLYGVCVLHTPEDKWPKGENLRAKYEEARKMAEEKSPEQKAKKEAEPKVPGVLGKHRSLGVGDEVAKDLAECKTVNDLVIFGKRAGLEKFKAIMGKDPSSDKEKSIALQDADKYLVLPNPGLVRMSIGNRLRGMEKKLTHKADSEKVKAAKADARSKQKEQEKADKEKAKAEKAAAQTAVPTAKVPKLKRA